MSSGSGSGSGSDADSGDGRGPEAAESDPTESAAYRQACEELVRRVLAGELEREDVEAAKLEVCGEFSAPKVPTNAALIRMGPDERREELEAVLRRKPVRTASGVTPVAVMTSPHSCPHGRCLYCPGGPASEFDSAQAYTGEEPAAARGRGVDYDPYAQVTLRLAQLREIGHPVDKVELILMGGTMTARSADYQAWFVRRALAAMNDFDPEDPPPTDGAVERAAAAAGPRALADVKARNERGAVRNVATTFETKPDWCDPEQVDRMLRLGATKVEVGVQTTYERVNREMHRGHGVQASVDATRRLREAAFKIGYHMMPGQPGTTAAMAVADLERVFADPRYRPDYLKIYPTLVVGGTRTYDMWRRGEYEPLSSAEAANVVARAKRALPPYVRLQRVQRDIPADLIEAGVQKSNLRQLARQRMADRGWTCDCIRCREVGHHDADPVDPTMETLTYEAAGGTEHFVSIEDRTTDPNVLVGFVRLRFPDEPRRPALEGAALLRELHVYGSEVGVGESGGDGDGDQHQHQHQGHGRRLMAEAERLAADAGYDRLAVIAGVGARRYYRDRLGYRQDGPYVTTRLPGG